MKEILLIDISPRPILREYVRKYQVFRFMFDKGIVPPPKFHAPRPEHCITFYIRDDQKFSYPNSDTILTYPQCVINGIYTTPIFRHGGNDFLAIKVVLQPTALYCLTGMPMQKLTNQFINAEEFFGKEIRLTCEQLKAVQTLNEMLELIENFLEILFKKAIKQPHPIDKVSRLILCQENNISMNWLASQSCLSLRQFIRKFEERVGVSAKMFSRITHFDRTYRMKNIHQHSNWLDIALACGYYDYQHLVKDYKEFTNFTPPVFFEQEKKSPERTFGLWES
jgi:AraC-like DNA-binding protein